MTEKERERERERERESDAGQGGGGNDVINLIMKQRQITQQIITTHIDRSLSTSIECMSNVLHSFYLNF